MDPGIHHGSRDPPCLKVTGVNGKRTCLGLDDDGKHNEWNNWLGSAMEDYVKGYHHSLNLRIDGTPQIMDRAFLDDKKSFEELVSSKGLPLEGCYGIITTPKPETSSRLSSGCRGAQPAEPAEQAELR